MLRTAIFFSFCLWAASLTNAAEWTMQLDLHGRSLEGKAIWWNDSKVYFLERNGRLWDFGIREPKNFRKTSSAFRGHSMSEMRGQLMREFGNHFEVSGTRHYLVVHPAGQRDLWAQRFEDLYRSFVHYFSVRGFRPRDPQFPLVAVVFHRQSDYLKYSAQNGTRVSANMLGYYSLVSNRVILYDRSTGQASQSNWEKNAAVIIHEATHQTGFNTGVHNRFTPQPRWLVEGVGMMFEARGVWDSHRYSSRSDRIHQGRLRQFKAFAGSRRRKDSIANLVSSDRQFKIDGAGAYSESWALSFYLAETQPRKYFQYLAKIAARPYFTEYRAPDRLRDFTNAFGGNLVMLDAQLLRFIGSL